MVENYGLILLLCLAQV